MLFYSTTLTNYTGKLQIRSTFAQNNGELYLTLSSSLNPDGTGLNFSGSNGTTPPTSGSIGVYIAACTSSALTFNEALYDLELYSGSGDCSYTVRLLEGRVQLSKQVTKDLSYGLDLNEIISKTESGELNEGNIMFFLGYSGWSDKQLLKEIKDDFWKINKNYSKNIFAKSRENLWKKLTEKKGGDSYLWSNAPENLQDN